MKNIVVLIVFCLSLMGCSSANYSCGSFNRSSCQPVSTVYADTNEGYDDYRKSGKLRKDARGYVNSKSKEPANIDIHVAQANRTLNYLVDGSPLLSKPVVLRILFTSWIDSDNDLNAGGYVYVKLKESKWFNEQN